MTRHHPLARPCQRLLSRPLAASLMAMAAALMLAAATPLAAQDAAPRQIVVTGQGEAAAVPDMAHVSIGVTHEAAAAGDALTKMSGAMTAVMARLESAGVAAADMQTGQLSLDPRYRYFDDGRTPEVTGFVATTTLNVAVRDLDGLGGVLDAVVRDGANTLGGVRFDLSDPAAALDDARRDAVADARARAQLYAEAAGVTLGDLLSLSESGGYSEPQPMYEARMAMDAMPVPVAEGQVRLTASVTMIYAID